MTAKNPDLLPAIKQLLVAGGDERITLNPSTGLNKYGCQPFPDSELLTFGSSTASVISETGYSIATQLHRQLLNALKSESQAAVYAQKMQELCRQWLDLCDLSDLDGLELIFSPSGTDTHGLVAQYVGREALKPTLVIMAEATETGSGVLSALTQNPFFSPNNVEVQQVLIRLEDGTPRLLSDIDLEVAALVTQAVSARQRVLLILVDQSKTGLLAPSPACVMALHKLYPDMVEVLVDACQFRLGLPTLRAYLKQGFMVALTGSKFLTGPSFSAVLLLPKNVAKRFQKNANSSFQVSDFGPVLRFAVALDELRRFRTVNLSAALAFMQAFAEAISQRLESDPHFEPLPVLKFDRRPLISVNNWDHLQTIFPFLLYKPETSQRIPLNREQTATIYQQLQSEFVAKVPTGVQSPLLTAVPNASETDIASIRCQLGQPVACGNRNDIPVSALRLCLSSRLLVEATSGDGIGEAIIKKALQVLDKTALLIR